MLSQRLWRKEVCRSIDDHRHPLIRSDQFFRPMLTLKWSSEVRQFEMVDGLRARSMILSKHRRFSGQRRRYRCLLAENWTPLVFACASAASVE